MAFLFPNMAIQFRKLILVYSGLTTEIPGKAPFVNEYITMLNFHYNEEQCQFCVFRQMYSLWYNSNHSHSRFSEYKGEVIFVFRL